MTAMFVSVADVRAYLDVEGTTGKYSDALIASNIRAASAYLQRETGRQFEYQSATAKKFTTNGQALVSLPDLRTATSVTIEGAAQDADETYWLMADSQQTGAYTSIQLRPFGTGGQRGYLSHPGWFDRNLDRYGSTFGSLPNDLVVTGDWGYQPADMPADVLHATKVLAAWYTKRPASVLANVAFTPDGSVLNYGDLPPEVVAFIKSWKLGAQMVAI